MPPFIPRKRLRSDSPEAGPSRAAPKAKGIGKSASSTRRKPTLFDDLDAGVGSKQTTEDAKALLEKLAATDDESSSLSSLSDAEFEDVPSAKRQKVDEASDDEDEDIEFEDVETHAALAPVGPPPSGDLELTLRKDTRISLTNPLGTKKGPSKIERGIRIATHQMHVQYLMWHNAIRNAWLCDKEVQDILLKQLSAKVMGKIEKWRQRSGLQPREEELPKIKGRAKAVSTKGKKADARSQRDWGEQAGLLASGDVDIKSNEAQFHNLLEELVNFWKERFRIAAPALRKIGYMSLERLDRETKSFNNDKHDPELHGERIKDLDEFRERAKSMEGSRDVGAQLFTALLRGLGLEARMVANLQPLGFGWNQNEDALETNPLKLKKSPAMKKPELDPVKDGSSEDDEGSDEEKPISKPAKKGKGKGKAPAKPEMPGKRRSRNSGRKGEPISLPDSDEEVAMNEDDESVIDVTPARPRVKASLPYDKDLLFPHYWTEVLSPVTNTYTVVDAIVLGVWGTSPEVLEKFEPRGTKADKAKQVTSYVVGHSSDGTAKDVTTRYLKRQVWPGRTKGHRLPVEKIPVYNRKGKIKHYEEQDWFKNVMSGYVRGSQKCPRTEIDDHEEATILKPVKLVKKEVEEGKETLQSYKTSTEYVLERHLKREEALVPGAEHVKIFTIKGKGEETIEEKVYLRKDVVNCKSMETWHKEGRAPIDGEEPLKRVPYRAATTNRRRELAEAEQASGGKVLQGLYSRQQTDWIIPPPIEDGIIPKNNFGNIDLYVDSMLPVGAAHIPRRGTVKICKRLGIDYAEAVTGFEFGHRMAVPIITGVVIAEENYEMVMEQWHHDELERERKEDEKRTKTAIGMWRKFLMGMRIIERVREEYGDEIDDNPDLLNPWTNRSKAKAVDKDTEGQARIMAQRDEDMAGGFLPEGHDEEDPDEHHAPSFFPVAHEGDDQCGGFVIEDDDQEKAKSSKGQAYATPQYLQSTKTRQVIEADEEMQDVESTIEAPAPKKRGRPSGSTKKAPKPTSKPKTPAKRAIQQKTPVSKSAGERKAQIADSEEDEDADDISCLSELESGSKSEVEVPKKVAKVVGKMTTMPANTATPRQTSRRAVARKSENGLRSRYFEHDDEDDEE